MRDSGDSSAPTQIPGHNRKAERPPLLKKSKTISDDDASSTPHFPGPLLPAVRRVSTLPPSSDLRLSLNTDASAHPTSTTNHIDFRNFSDRDWMFPSFLGPHAARSRAVADKPPKSASQAGGRGVPGLPGIRTAEKEALKQRQLTGSQTHRCETKEEESKSVTNPALTIQSTPLTQLSGSRSSWKRFCSLSLVLFPLSLLLLLFGTRDYDEMEEINGI